MSASNWRGKMEHVLGHMRGTRCHLVVPVLAAVLLLLHPRDATGKNFNFLYSDHLKGGLCTNGIRGEVVDVTILDCTRTCANDRLCISFIYDDITSTCHLYSQALNVTDDCVNHADHYFSYYFKLVGEEEVSAEVISAESPEESESSQDESGSSGRSSSEGSDEDCCCLLSFHAAMPLSFTFGLLSLGLPVTIYTWCVVLVGVVSVTLMITYIQSLCCVSVSVVYIVIM